jgi:hypothetical protein
LSLLGSSGNKTDDSDTDTVISATQLLHERNYNHHQYFSSSLRQISLASNLITIIPNPKLESDLKKAVLTKLKDRPKMSLKEYDQIVEEVLLQKCDYVDVKLNETIGKRYLFSKKDANRSVIPITQHEWNSLNKRMTT